MHETGGTSGGLEWVGDRKTRDEGQRSHLTKEASKALAVVQLSLRVAREATGDLRAGVLNKKGP